MLEHPIQRVGAGPRLAAAALDYVMSTFTVMACAWQGWGWFQLVESMPGLDGVRELYAPVEAMLVEAGLDQGLTSLLAASALVGVAYPMVEGFSGASPGKWIMGIRIARPDGTRGDLGLYLRRFLVKFVRPVFATVGAVSGISTLGFLAGPAGLVVTVGTLLLLAPHRQALHDKLAGTAVFLRGDVVI
jgi:uncharacterized RDD family membrane protein YckC